MRLHDLFEADLNVGMQNLNKIARAVQNSSPVEIMLGNEPVTLEYPEARFVYGMYKSAVRNGNQENFMMALSDPQRFDRIMKVQRDILYKDRGEEMAQATARRLGESKGSKPDFLDMDKDGNKKEPMKKAVADKKGSTQKKGLPEGYGKGKHFGLQEEESSFENDQEGPAELLRAVKEEINEPGMHLDNLIDVRDGAFGSHDSISFRAAMRFIGKYIDEVEVAEGDVAEYIMDNDLTSHLRYAAAMLERILGITESYQMQNESWDDDDDWYGFKDKNRKTAGGGTVTQTSTGVVHKGKYGSEYQGDDGDEDDYDEWGNLKPKAKQARAAAKAAKAAETPKRGRGRPSAAIQAGDSGATISDYGTWYRKTKREHPERKIAGSANKAVAVIPKGKKFAVVGSWSGSKGTIDTKPGELLTADQLKADYKTAKGRPKKVREWIETLRFIAEGKV